MFRHVFFHAVRQTAFGFFLIPNTVQQECTAIFQTFQHIIFGQISRNVAGHEVGGIDQISGTNGFVAKPQVRDGDTARFFGIVSKIGLCIFIGRLADDLDGVFVGSHGTIGTQAVKFGFKGSFIAQAELRQQRQRFKGHVIHNTHGEMILRLRLFQVVENRNNLCRSGIFGTQAITSAHDDGGIFTAVKSFINIKIKRFAIGSGFFGTIEYGNPFYRFRNGFHQVIDRKRPVQMNGHQTGFFPFGIQVINGFANGFGNRSHGNDNVLGIFGTIISKRMILTAG